MTRDDIHTCSYECERPACIKAQRDELAKRLFELVAEAVAAEREECAKVCEEIEEKYHRREGKKRPDERSDAETGAGQCADAIRERQEQPR